MVVISKLYWQRAAVSKTCEIYSRPMQNYISYRRRSLEGLLCVLTKKVFYWEVMEQWYWDACCSCIYRRFTWCPAPLNCFPVRSTKGYTMPSSGYKSAVHPGGESTYLSESKSQHCQKEQVVFLAGMLVGSLLMLHSPTKPVFMQ